MLNIWTALVFPYDFGVGQAAPQQMLIICILLIMIVNYLNTSSRLAPKKLTNKLIICIRWKWEVNSLTAPFIGFLKKSTWREWYILVGKKHENKKKYKIRKKVRNAIPLCIDRVEIKLKNLQQKCIIRKCENLNFHNPLFKHSGNACTKIAN